jgi:hypothetical protein
MRHILRLVYSTSVNRASRCVTRWQLYWFVCWWLEWFNMRPRDGDQMHKILMIIESSRRCIFPHVLLTADAITCQQQLSCINVEEDRINDIHALIRFRKLLCLLRDVILTRIRFLLSRNICSQMARIALKLQISTWCRSKNVHWHVTFAMNSHCLNSDADVSVTASLNQRLHCPEMISVHFAWAELTIPCELRYAILDIHWLYRKFIINRPLALQVILCQSLAFTGLTIVYIRRLTDIGLLLLRPLAADGHSTMVDSTRHLPIARLVTWRLPQVASARDVPLRQWPITLNVRAVNLCGVEFNSIGGASVGSVAVTTMVVTTCLNTGSYWHKPFWWTLHNYYRM